MLRFTREELAIPADQLAPKLLGAVISRGEVSLRIVETEAYGWPDDTACHAHRGETPRNAPMFGPAGHAYVYLCYGIHYLFNVSCGQPGEGTAVLIRACEVLAGENVVAERRDGRRGFDALNGPGKVGAALGLSTDDSGSDLLERRGLQLYCGNAPNMIVCAPRIGIDYAEQSDRERYWRFAEQGSKWVSRPFPKVLFMP